VGYRRGEMYKFLLFDWGFMNRNDEKRLGVYRGYSFKVVYIGV